MTILRALYFDNPNKNTQVYTRFHIFSSFLKIFIIFSAVGVKEPPLGFDNRLLHNFW